MFSRLRSGLVYLDISKDIIEHDEDIDADQWSYDNRDVYRGRFDPKYTSLDMNVYWLYDDNLNRIGLAEHESDDPEIFEVLWFRDNPYATLYQDDRWKSRGKTLWSLLSHEAYLDCLEDDFKTIFDRCLSSKYKLVTPSMLIENPKIYECNVCKKRSFCVSKKCKDITESSYLPTNSILFIDDSFVIYEPPTPDPPQNASSEQAQMPSEQGSPQLESSGEQPQ
jgi:hypothetical protein